MIESELKSLLEYIGVKKISRRQDEMVFCCPFHEDNNPSFGISLVKPGHPGNCFTGCFQGSLTQFVSKVEGISFGEARKVIERFGTDFVPEMKSSEVSRKKSLKRRFEFFRKNLFSVDSIPSDLVSFLRSDGRFLRFKDLAVSDIGLDSANKKLVFAWRDLERNIVSLSYTSYFHRSRGYFKGTHPGEGLFYAAAPERPLPTSTPLVVVESPLDAAIVRRATGRLAVALGRARATTAQVAQIEALADFVVVFLDQDRAGREGAEWLVSRLQVRSYQISETPGGAKDAARMPPATLRALLT